MSQDAFICDAIRTPFGRYGGSLSAVRADDLGAVPIAALMKRNPQIDWSKLDDVMYGCANQAGEDNRNVARMSALLAGLPVDVPGVTLNRLCGSGLDAIGSAARAIRAGDWKLQVSETPNRVWLFNLREVRWLKLGFGLFVIVLALLQLRLAFARLQTLRPLATTTGALMLIGGGIVHGLFSTGGPNIVYVLGREIEDKGAFRSTISAMFVPMTTALLIDYAMLGLFTREVLVAIAWALVPSTVRTSRCPSTATCSRKS